jgi:hypothetical protein
MRGIPSQSVELVKVLNHTSVVLLHVKEFIPLHLDQSSGDVGLAELSGELLLVDHMVFSLHGLEIVPPCPSRSSKEVRGEKNLLIVSNSCNFQIVLNGAQLVVRIKGCNALGEHRWVGVLEVSQSGPWCFLTIPLFVVIVVTHGEMCNLPQCRDVGLTFSSGGLEILHHKAQDLGHVGIRWGWGWRVILA